MGFCASVGQRACWIIVNIGFETHPQALLKCSLTRSIPQAVNSLSIEFFAPNVSADIVMSDPECLMVITIKRSPDSLTMVSAISAS